jgi:integrase
MSKLYNEEIKERFLSNYDNEQTQTTIRNVFAKTELVERVLEKDLYSMNLTELGKCIENINPHNLNVAKSTGRFISQYLTFCTENGYRESNINPLKGVDDEFYDKYVDKSKKIHFSFDEFLQLLDDQNLHNSQDKSFLFLIFEGITGEQFGEIRDLTIKDINWDENKIFIKSRNQYITVSKECMTYLEKTINEKTYYNYNSKTKEFNERELLPSEYVFKTTKSPRASEGQPVGMSMLYTRLHALKEILDLQYLTPNAIKQSGMIKMAVDIFKEDGVLGYDQFAKIGEKYNFSKINSNNNGIEYEYYNTYLMKEFINEDNIKELYGLDVVIQKR